VGHLVSVYLVSKKLLNFFGGLPNVFFHFFIIVVLDGGTLKYL
jgi:hypothetical protein